MLFRSIGGTGSGFSVTVTQILTGYGTISGTDHPLFIVNDVSESAKGLAFASAYCVFDGTQAGTNPPFPGAYNVSSITTNAAGSYSVNLIRPMATANCAGSVTTNSAAAAASTRIQNVSSSTQNVFTYVNGVLTANNQTCVVLFGG